MKTHRYAKLLTLVAAGALLLQFGGCLSPILADIFFAVGPLLL